jgi:hypothetical protein
MKIYKPKEDFNNNMAIQNQYVKLLQAYHKELIEKVKTTKGFQKSKYEVEFYEVSMNLDRQSILLREKIDHYNNNFIETYEEELKECEENFENYYKNALQIFEKNFDMWVIELKDLIKKVEDGLIKIDEREESYSKYPKEKSINLGLINEERLKLRNRQKGIIGMLNASEHTKQIRYEKIKYLIDDFDKETEENRNHIELKNNLYKDLKNLVNLPNIE